MNTRVGGGRSGIRTRGTRKGSHAFQAGPFDHSGTLPYLTYFSFPPPLVGFLFVANRYALGQTGNKRAHYLPAGRQGPTMRPLQN